MGNCVYTIMGNSAYCEGHGFLNVGELRAIIADSSDIFITHNRELIDLKKSVNIHYLIKLLATGGDIGNSKLAQRNDVLVTLFKSGVRAHMHAGIPVQNYSLDELIPRHSIESYLITRTELTRSIFDAAAALPYFDKHLNFYVESVIPLDYVLADMATKPVATASGPELIEMSPGSTRLGRLSVVKGPNILNLRKAERKNYVSRYEGGELVQYDFKAIDMRVAFFDAGYTHVAKEPDLYSQIKVLTGLPMRRSNVKVLSLGRLYGMSMDSASKKFGVPRGRIEEYIGMFNAAFADIATRRKSIENEFRDNKGVVFNWFGRTVHVDKQRNAYQNYIASNTADICALAYRAVHAMLKSDPERQVAMFLHDAVIIDQAPGTPREDIAAIMRSVISDLGTFHVNITSGSNLMEATE